MVVRRSVTVFFYNRRRRLRCRCLLCVLIGTVRRLSRQHAFYRTGNIGIIVIIIRITIIITTMKKNLELNITLTVNHSYSAVGAIKISYKRNIIEGIIYRSSAVTKCLSLKLLLKKL